MDVSEFEMRIDHKGGRIIFALSNEEESIRVTVSRIGLSAAWDAPFYPDDAVKFSSLFDDLSRHAAHWKNAKSVSSGRGNELTLECSFADYITNEESTIECRFTLASDFQEPWWKVDLNFVLELEALPDLATRAAAFFDTLKRRLETELV